MDLRLTAAITASKASASVIRRLGRGGGTAAPGLVANLLDPSLLDKLSRRVRDGCVVVAGTNGKTTTARMLATILERDHRRVIHNRTGSNLVRGISAAFAEQSRVTGKPNGEIAVIEADEFAFPEVVRRTHPRLVLLLNLFRDQLDRYGELDTVAQRWSKTLGRLDAGQTMLINADDPALAFLSDQLTARRLTFGIESTGHRLGALPHAADSTACRRCGHQLDYTAVFLSHLGDYHCPNCGFERPVIDYAGHDVAVRGLDAVDLNFVAGGEVSPLRVAIPGLYNAYNALAAAGAARALGVPQSVIAASLAEFRSAFGRIERVEYRGRSLVIVLIKNPVGFNEVLRTLTAGGIAEPTLIVINDLDADGRDVSWLWDVDVEQLACLPAPLYTAGLRGPDMALRLKYAGVPTERISELGQLDSALDAFVEQLPPGGRAYILPTYTAMLELREILQARGAVAAFWRQ